MSRTMPALVLALLLTAAGIVHGLWTNRWTGGRTAEAAARLQQLPLTFGDWEGRKGELPERQVQVADLAGYLTGDFVNRRTGDVVSLLIVCGRPGPVSVHPPEVCYAGQGFEPAGDRARFSPTADPTTQFWASRFQKPDPAGPQNLRILYAWNAAGSWRAPDNPRLTFARYPALYKVYVIRRLPRGDEPLDARDPGVQFLRAVLPELKKTLFPAA